MIPSNTLKVLGTSIHQCLRADPKKFYAVSGGTLNELYALAMRFSYMWNDGDERRDWQNRLNEIATNATLINGD